MSLLANHQPVLSVIAAGAAALICGCLTRLLMPLLQRYALARPNARSSHIIPTPQGAGIAAIAATLLVIAAWSGMTGLPIPAMLFAATLLISLVGFADDVRPIPVLPRLLMQAAAVATVVFATPTDLRISSICPLEIERTLLMLAGLWFVNLVNFMDGLDLMTVVEVVPITAAMGLLGWMGYFPDTPAMLATALCGAMLGFAPFNRPVARVFLGDVGSLPIGLMLGWCLLQLAWHQQLMAAFLLPLYYLADASLTLVRRIAKGEQFWMGHRSHFYQQATDNGFTVSRVVTEVFVLNLFLATLAILSVGTSSSIVGIFCGLAGTASVVLQLYRFSRKRS